jgi:transcriptional regulator with XRE-family HTH domain
MLGAELKRRRLELELTLQEMARQLGISYAVLWRWEHERAHEDVPEGLAERARGTKAAERRQGRGPYKVRRPVRAAGRLRREAPKPPPLPRILEAAEVGAELLEPDVADEDVQMIEGDAP